MFFINLYSSLQKQMLWNHIPIEHQVRILAEQHSFELLRNCEVIFIVVQKAFRSFVKSQNLSFGLLLHFGSIFQSSFSIFATGVRMAWDEDTHEPVSAATRGILIMASEADSRYVSVQLINITHYQCRSSMWTQTSLLTPCILCKLFMTRTESRIPSLFTFWRMQISIWHNNHVDFEGPQNRASLTSTVFDMNEVR